MAKTPFDYWKDVTQNKCELEDEASYQPYMMTRLCSMVQVRLPFAEELTRLDLPKDIHYELLEGFLPKRYIKLDYIKKKSENKDNSIVSKYFEFGSRDLKLANKILSEDDVDIIKKKYGGLEK